MDTGSTCLPLNGYGMCVIACLVDADCPDSGLPCVGQADEGLEYCTDPCMTSDDCGDVGVCAGGECRCSADADCGPGRGCSGA